MNTPPAKAGGFSGKLCGNPLAWRPKAGSRPEVGPLQDDPRGRHVAVEVRIRIRRCASVPTSRLARSPRTRGIPGSCRADRPGRPSYRHLRRLVRDALDELVPRGVVDGPGEHPTCEPGQCSGLSKAVRLQPIHQGPGQLVREVAALVATLAEAAAQRGLRLAAPVAAPLAAGHGALVPPRPPGGLPGEARRLDRLAFDSATSGSGPGRCPPPDRHWRPRPELGLEADEPLPGLAGDDRVRRASARRKARCQTTLIWPGTPTMPRRRLLRSVSPSPTRISTLSNRLRAGSAGSRTTTPEEDAAKVFSTRRKTCCSR